MGLSVFSDKHTIFPLLLVYYILDYLSEPLSGKLMQDDPAAWHWTGLDCLLALGTILCPSFVQCHFLISPCFPPSLFLVFVAFPLGVIPTLPPPQGYGTEFQVWTALSAVSPKLLIGGAGVSGILSRDVSLDLSPESPTPKSLDSASTSSSVTPPQQPDSWPKFVEQGNRCSWVYITDILKQIQPGCHQHIDATQTQNSMPVWWGGICRSQERSVPRWEPFQSSRRTASFNSGAKRLISNESSF